MIPVMQDKFYQEDRHGNIVSNGNCLSACVASILELPLEEVPFFILFTDWEKELRNFLRERGYKLRWHYGYHYPAPEGYSIAQGLSYRSRKDKALYHGVVYNDGVLCHDPHFEGNGIAGPVMAYLSFEKLSPKRPDGTDCDPNCAEYLNETCSAECV